MKRFLFDPHLIKWGIIALVLVGRAIAATNHKRREQNRQLQPPQSGPLSSSLGASQPSISPAPPPLSSRPQRQSNVPDSPWSDLK